MYRLSVHEVAKRMKLAVGSKAAGLLFTVGCVMTFLSTYQIITTWWQRPPSTVHAHLPSQDDQLERSKWTELRQQHRQRHLDEICSSGNDSKSVNPGTTLIVSDQLRLLFCVVGKAACTSWIRVLLQLTGNQAAQHVSLTDRQSVHTMFRFYLAATAFPSSSDSERYSDYYKFMFVREPLERLVSAYRDKMFRSAEYIHVRQQIVARSRQAGDDVTFDEFVRYVLEQKQQSGVAAMDHHWRPQYSLCLPCHLRYDFIGHYETLADDATHVLAAIARRYPPHTDRYTDHVQYNTTQHVQFPRSDLDSRTENSHVLLEQFYGNLSTHSTLALLRLYRKDFETFQYDIPDVVQRKLATYRLSRHSV